jgi:DNA-binding response OmpR family regulator
VATGHAASNTVRAVVTVATDGIDVATGDPQPATASTSISASAASATLPARALLIGRTPPFPSDLPSAIDKTGETYEPCAMWRSWRSAPAPRPTMRGMGTGPAEALRILVVEDDRALRAVLVSATEGAGYSVVAVGDGLAAARELRGGAFDAVLLDIGLPVVDGWHILGELEGRRIPPVIVISARGEERDKVRALDLGADDYLAKPFGSEELLARLRAVLRRARPGRRPLSASPTLRTGDLRMDRISRRAWLRDTELVLTPKAMLLLDYLITHPDELMTRDRLLEVLWGFDFPVGTRAVDNRIAELRRALDDDPSRPEWIATVPGQGYRFVARVDDAR